MARSTGPSSRLGPTVELRTSVKQFLTRATNLIDVPLLYRTGSKLLPEGLKRRIKVSCGTPDTDACLGRLKLSGFSPCRTIDIGAYSGEWTSKLLELFPDAQVLMIEPQEIRRRELEALCSSHPRVELANVLLGSKETDSVPFYESDTASSVLQDANHNNQACKMLPMTTLDLLIGKRKFPPPDFIKLDVQGYEIEVLEGAAHALKSAQIVLMEVNLIPIYKDAPLAHEAFRYMADRGFRLHDVGTFFRRPYDDALWQMDVFFVRSSSPLVSSTRWS